MIGGHRLAVLGLLSLCLTAWVVGPGRMAAQPRPVEIRTVQEIGPMSPEPPLVGEPAAPGGAAVADPPVPVVAVRVRVPATATVGQEVTYHIFVDNISKATAHRVALRATKPTHATVRTITPNPDPDAKDGELHWSIGTLEACGSKEITVVAVPDGSGEVSLTARVSFEHGQTVVTHLNQPELRLLKTGPAQARVNDTIRYQLEVTNTGSADAAEVMVTDELPEGLLFLNVVKGSPTERGSMPLRWELGVIPAGQTRRIEYEVATAKTGHWTNKAVVTTGNLRQEASHTVTIGEPKLSIVKTGPLARLANRPAVFYITVSNSGNAPLPDVEIEDILADGVTFVSATAGGRQVGKSVVWSVGTLPAGGRKTVQLVLRVSVPGILDNRATAVGKGHPLVLAKTVTQFLPATSPAIEIDKSGDPLEAGKQGVYFLRVVNPTQAPLTNVTLKVTGNEAVKFLKPRGPTEGILDGEGRVVQFKPLAHLAPGVTEWTIAVETPASGEARLKVEMSALELKNPVIVEDTTAIWSTMAQP